MVKIVEQICATCEFYDVIRCIGNAGICTLDPSATTQSIVEPTDSCDQWLTIQPRKTLNDAKPEEWDAVAKLGKKSHV